MDDLNMNKSNFGLPHVQNPIAQPPRVQNPIAVLVYFLHGQSRKLVSFFRVLENNSEGGVPPGPKKGVKMEEGFEKILKITEEEEEEMEIENDESCCSTNHNNKSTETIDLLRRFLGVQQRRAEAYAKLRSGFNEYMVGGGDLAYQQVCREITEEFNDCSKQVLEIESLFLNPDFCRDDLAQLLRSVQGQEKEKLNLTVTIQVLKKAGRPSERPVSHENCRFRTPAEHECMHVHEITVAAGTEEAEADADYDGALKEAIRGVQDAVMSINEHLEEVRYEIEALEAQ